jgi:Lar family restriction alleviation protein
MSETLLPCPFCGGEAAIFQGSDENQHTVRCVQCAIKMPIMLNREGAIEAWNQRAEQDAVPVVRGRWRTWEEQFPDRTTRKKNNLGVFCSACQLHADNMTSYCPNCGAKMEDKP